jgi:hypothetical protein
MGAFGPGAGGGTPFDPNSPGPIGGDAPDEGYFTTLHADTLSGDGGGLTGVPVLAGLDNTLATPLLYNFEGANAATTATNEGIITCSAVFAGNAQIATAQKKFGSSSLRVDGNSSSKVTITVPYFGLPRVYSGVYSGVPALWRRDCTIEIWARWNALDSGYMPLLGAGDDDDSQGPVLYFESGSGTLRLLATRYAGSWSLGLDTGWRPSTGTWYHIAATRNGDTFTVWVDGVSKATGTLAGTIYQASKFYPGHYPYFPGGAKTMDGWLDGLRISSFARYTAGFTPPATAPAVTAAATAGTFKHDGAGYLYVSNGSRWMRSDGVG